MSTFNQYNLYSYTAGEALHACDDKILVDIQRLKSIYDIDEVNEYIDKTFGLFENQKAFTYPNGVLVYISKTENKVNVIALQKNKQIFGECWYLEDEQ